MTVTTYEGDGEGEENSKPSRLREVREPLTAETVFTPTAYPTYTYVSRSVEDEDRLRDALKIGGMVVSVVGPSKTGKTVLVNRVVDRQRLISLSGATINSPDDIWSQAAINVGMRGFDPAELMDLFANDEYFLLIDDFHYVERSLQRRIAQQLKDAVAKGVRVILVAVPHRGDDPIRANPDLRGRVQIIDMDYWSQDQLGKIAGVGFPLLNIELVEADIMRLTDESLRSPQLMQALCLETCRQFDLRDYDDAIRPIAFVPGAFERIATATSALTDCKTPFQILSEGPREHGQKRTTYTIRSTAEAGHVYNVILEALSLDPPRLDFSYNELKRRAAELVDGDPPPGASLQQAVGQMNELVRKKIPDDRVFEWDEERQYIDIPDPYFLFYLRWGKRR